MHLAPKIFATPRRYVQGPGVIRTIAGKQMAIFGRKAIVIGGPRSLEAVKEAGLYQTLDSAGISYVIETFGRECTHEEIKRLTDIGQDAGCDLAIAVGGGKAMDAGKVVGDTLGESIMIPTQVGTNASESALSVIYTKDHVFEEYKFLNKNPALLLVDTEVIAKSPIRYLIGGIGDASSEKFEGEACYRTGSKNLIEAPEWVGYTSALSLKLCQLAYEYLREYGEAALESAARQAVTPALENIVEAIILWSGAGFECTGLAGAHSIHNGITEIEHLIPENKRPLHGEIVAWGVIAQLFLENRPRKEIEEYAEWARRVALPMTFEEMGFPSGSPNDEDLWKAAEKACAEGETIHCMAFDIQPQWVFDAMKTADEFGKKVAKRIPKPTF